ncbi:MAG TPA: V-type ATPase 116kDa subunit family protein [Candidatus Nanoarchaeia archaeon]|nr:V-type ATPase 116kDa subunit family protein [Candidatus Nanoarchaeia archaeon]
MKPEEMTKIRIVTPKSLGNAVISALYNLSTLHVKQHQAEHNLQNGSPLPASEELSKTWLKVRTLKNELNIQNPAKNVISTKQIHKVTEQLYNDIQQMKTKEQTCTTQLNTTTQSHEIASALDSMKVDSSLIPKLRHVSCFLGFVRDSAQLHGKLAKIPHELKQKAIDQQTLIVLFVRKQDELHTQAALHELGWSPLGTIPQDASVLKKQLDILKKELNDLKSRHEKTKRDNAQFLADAEAVLEAEIKKAELPLQFATTAQSFIATGFVPKKSMPELKSALERATKKSIFIEELHMHHDEKVPVKLANNKKVKNFEVLTRLYELPSYFEVDPTSLLFITFPIFYGIMLGDVVYGLILFFLFMFLKRKLPDAKAWFNVLMYAALMSIVFGAVFGEYLGFEHVSAETGQSLCQNIGLCLHKEIVTSHGESHIVYSFPHLMNRAHDTVEILGTGMLTVLVLSVIVGAIHLNFGLLLGFLNVYHAHGLKMAILEKASWFIMELGIVLIILSKMNAIVIPWLVGLVIFLISIVMVYLGEGAKGIVEIPSLFSNMLSYMRLGALGLASVVLAVVVNDGLALPLMEKGGLFIPLAIVIMICGHTINIALGVIGPFLHSIRLHYVEFYSKFFSGGGTEYMPFGKKAQMEGE